ncbi:MAG: PDDEXK nuclease domain-containing protein [Ferruginibacter sp.]
MENKVETKGLFLEIKQLVEQSRNNVAVTVNAEITLLYWNIGKRINEDILKNGRAEYGKGIVASLSKQLGNEYGTGWSKRHLHNCLRIAETFQDEAIVHALRTQLSWTHIRTVMYIDDELKRNFYIEMCKMDKWSTRTLENRINSMLYERTAISKLPEETIMNDLALLKNEQKINPDLVFRDPYFLDFLGLKNTFSEKDLESAILAELQDFIVELGSDFAFMARQKRITIDNDDYYIDLLFFHRRLRCLVAIELKIGKFTAADKGQVELYLRWLEKHEMQQGENNPIGLILCTHKNEEHVELLQLDKSNIRVTDYLTELPDKKLLENKLHQSIEMAKSRLAQHKDYNNGKED